MYSSLFERVKSFPDATLEDLCNSSSPKVRFEFYAEVDGIEQAFYSVDGYRIGTLICARKDLPDHGETAQKILDETIKKLNDQVNNVGFTTKIDVIEKGRYREHSF